MSAEKGRHVPSQFIDKKASTSEIANLPNAAGISAVAGLPYINADGTVRQMHAGGDRVPKVAILAITGAALHAGVLNWQNPEGVDIIIEKTVLDVRTVATGAATVDTGTTAVSATTASDTLMDGLDVNAALIVADNITNKGTNGLPTRRLATGKWVTVKEATGDATGLVAELYISYHRAQTAAA